jgi:hypothetical protein
MPAIPPQVSPGPAPNATLGNPAAVPINIKIIKALRSMIASEFKKMDKNYI